VAAAAMGGRGVESLARGTEGVEWAPAPPSMAFRWLAAGGAERKAGRRARVGRFSEVVGVARA
jgi:hypothetical protein